MLILSELFPSTLPSAVVDAIQMTAGTVVSVVDDVDDVQIVEVPLKFGNRPVKVTADGKPGRLGGMEPGSHVEDNRHALLHVKLHLAEHQPVAGVVGAKSDDDITACRYDDRVLDGWR